MGLFSFVVFIGMWIVASIQNSQHKAFLADIDRRYNAAKRKQECFKEMYGASDELVEDALRHERDMTPLAQYMKQRLLDEAGFDQGRNEELPIKWCHTVALAILAQQGKIPNDFLDYGIVWSAQCYEKRSHGFCRSSEAAEMMERFVRWYDNELTEHGVPESLCQCSPGKKRPDPLREGIEAGKMPIRCVEKIDVSSRLFWPSCCVDLWSSCSFIRICGRLIR